MTKQNEKIQPIVSAQDFLADRLPEPPQVIHGVIRAGQVGMMAASSKAGKSWALLSLAFAVANGGEWLDWHTTKGRVLYINAELPPYDLQQRLDIIASATGRSSDLIDVWHLRGAGRAIRALIPFILARIEKNGEPYVLIIPDPLYCFGEGRDENDNAEQAKTMGEMSELAERSTAAVWAAHHFSKGNKSQTDHLDRASGAGMFARAVDVFITMTRHTEEDCYTVETTCRSFARPEPFVVRWEYPLWRVDDTLDPYDLKPIGHAPRPPRFTVENILLLLPKQGLTYTDWKVAAEKMHGMKETTFAGLLRKARANGSTEKDVFGKYTRTAEA